MIPTSFSRHIATSCFFFWGVLFAVNAQQMDGFALYNTNNSSTAYLIDAEGDIAHTWSCPTQANYALALRDNGNIVRGCVNNSNQLNGAAVGGKVQELDPEANVVWEFNYSTSEVVTHHDLALMPNGHVLLTAWEVVEGEELDNLGYTGNGSKLATHFIEVAQDGTGGEIVWEWHIKDHMVQDVNPDLENYGQILDHPELLNANLSTGGGGPPGGGGSASDWFHVNGVDYNPDLDQIVFSSRFLSEIFVIDHSTTTEEAAGHTGGNSGQGGDFLYRWGKPANYGASGAQVITSACHDARWIIDDGRPNGGFIQVFNNSGNGGGSAVDAVDAPHEGYNYAYTPGAAFEPTNYSWRHECMADAPGQSAADRMADGNIFVNLSSGQGGAGYMYEMDMEGNLLFQYNAQSQKAFRYPCDHPGIQALLANPCGEATGLNERAVLNWTVFPNPASGGVDFVGEFGLDGLDEVSVRDASGRLLQTATRVNRMDFAHYAPGVYFLEARNAGSSSVRRVVIQ